MFWYFLEFLFLSVIVVFLSMVFMASSVGSLLLPLICLLSSLIFLGFINFDEVMSLLLFLIYTGGILVMFIYAMIMSSNYIFAQFSTSYVMSIASSSLLIAFLMYMFGKEGSMVNKSSLLKMDFFMMDLMGLMLLLVFVSLYAILATGSFTINDSTSR